MSKFTNPIKITIPEFGFIESKDLYLKSEVDAYISELEEKHKMEVEQLLIENQKLKKAQCWHEFNKEKPKHFQRVLVCSKYYKPELRRWDDGCEFDVEVQEIYTHWMSLPEAPEESL